MTRGIFEPGVAYIGTAMIDKDRKKVFQVVARRGRTVSIVHVKGVVRELVDCCDGTEFFRIQDADLQQGYPGNFTAEVTYTLTDDNALRLKYKAKCDQDTVYSLPASRRWTVGA